MFCFWLPGWMPGWAPRRKHAGRALRPPGLRAHASALWPIPLHMFQTCFTHVLCMFIGQASKLLGWQGAGSCGEGALCAAAPLMKLQLLLAMRVQVTVALSP